MELCYLVMREHAFRKSLMNPTSRSVLNVALFDVLSVLFTKADEDVVKADKNEIREVIRGLMQDPDFELALSRSTNSTKMVRTRFMMAEETLLPLLS